MRLASWLTLVAGCLLVLTVPAAAASAAAKWIVLIDAGSTGSRAHVHQYTWREGKPLPVVEESINKKIKPGLSDCAAKPASATNAMQHLLSFIRETVPKDQWAVTPIHLQATAGLRSVTPAEASAILEVVRDDLAASGFVFERHWARVIPGEQEGINGWMAVNYLLGVFDQPASADGRAPVSTGVVEMGGSSMQITFAPEQPSEEDRKALIEKTIAGHTYRLYTHSFLQYGLQAAEKLYQRLAINDIEEKGNPCYPRAYRHSSVGDFDRCMALLAKVVDKSIKCASTCSFNGVYQPRIGNEQFLAIENFYYTAKFFGTDQLQDQKRATSDNSAAAQPTGNQVTTGLRLKGHEFCNKDWPVLLEEYAPKQTPASELSTFCFSAAYQSVVLESGLGFHAGANLRVAKTINGKGIDWEMGAVLFELIGAGSSAEKPAEARGVRVVELDPTLPLPINGARVRGEDAAGASRLCKSCLVYTVFFALVVVLGYLGYVRYSRKAGGPMTSYSQSAFGRV